MIESHVMEFCGKIARSGGRIILLGDQIPAFGSGFASAKDWAASLNMSCLSIDYDGRADVTADLNYPLPAELSGTADIVYDGGVLEHVANIGAAWMSITKILKVGGCVIHCNPINCYGESYYGLDPMVFRDIYQANGFSVLCNEIYSRTGWRVWAHSFLLKYFPRKFIEAFKRRCNTPAVKTALLKDRVKDIKFTPAAETNQWQFRPHLAHTFFVAYKAQNVQTWIWPAQSCYPKV